MNVIHSQIDMLLGASDASVPVRRKLWGNIEVERRRIRLGSLPSRDFVSHHVLLWTKEPTVVERDYKVGRFDKVIKRPGTLSLGRAGRMPTSHMLTPSDVIVCTISEQAVSEMLQELDQRKPAALHDHLGVEDERLAALMRLLAIEAESGGTGGRLYCDGLEQAAVARFVAVGTMEQPDDRSPSPLPRPILRRIIDKMEQECDTDLTLRELAKESGYSRSHFLRMFEAATGKTPFRYLRDLRLEKARLALVETSEDITSIAFATGFSSHSHLTRLFTSKFGCPPSTYRRRAREPHAFPRHPAE